MYFFDCNVSYGIIANKEQLKPVYEIDGLLKDIDNAGVKKAVVYRYEQLYGAEPALGNKLIADDVKDKDNLYGLWCIVPSDTNEIESPENITAAMKKNSIIGWKIAPECHRFSKKPYVLEDYFQVACENNIPVYINTADGYSLENVGDILESFPNLTVILTYDNVWPNDRYLRPFVRKFKNVYLELSQVITAGGLEDFTTHLGSTRLLFGSGYPVSYIGAGMLMIKKSNLYEKDKENIAYRNMERIIGGVRYD